jgi:general stress protein 26
MLAVDWNAKVKEALERTDIMALSTIGDDGSWTSPVQFTYSSQLVLSFLSMMDAKHVTNILKDPRVSVAIYKPEPFPGGGNLGLQIKGKTRLITGQHENNGWHRFQITPEEIWCFDSQVSLRRNKIDLTNLVLPH